jgi:prevent-host-death family protein
MMVSVREFRAHLSRYLKAAEHGESVLVTARNRPVARLVPARQAAGPEDELARLMDAPGIEWDGGKPQGARVSLRPGEQTASEMVLEYRR